MLHCFNRNILWYTWKFRWYYSNNCFWQEFIVNRIVIYTYIKIIQIVKEKKNWKIANYITGLCVWNVRRHNMILKRWFIQDGNQFHRSTDVFSTLKTIFCNRIIGLDVDDLEKNTSYTLDKYLYNCFTCDCIKDIIYFFNCSLFPCWFQISHWK